MEQTPDQARKDLSTAYQTMVGLVAWKHFVKTVLDPIEERALADEDSVPITNLDQMIGIIAESRGKRAAVKKIRIDVQFILDGGII